MKQQYIYFFLALFTIQISYAQPSNRNRSFERPEIIITGKIVDLETETPLAYATIAFFSQRDSTVLGGGITDDMGNFSTKIKAGKCYARVDFLGYKTKLIEQLPIDLKQIRSGITNFDIGTVELQSDGIALNEIEVTAEKSETTFSLDKRVFTVGKDLANRGGTAQEILDNVPSVTVDIEGEVSLRGSSGVRILVDGKPSGYQNNVDALKQIPANLIEVVEVITNPSARYEAEGQAGIINIKLKKQKRSGFNGSFDATVGLPYNLGFSANVNYRKNKINWFANLGISDKRNFGGGFQYSEFLDTNVNEIKIQDQTTRRERNGFNYNARFGFDYFLTDKEIITGAFRYRDGYSENENSVIIDFYDAAFVNQNLNSNSSRTEFETEDDSDAQYSLTYNRKFANPKNELNLSVTYQDDLEQEFSYFDEIFTTFENGTPTINKIPQQAFIDEGSKEWIFNGDYVKPLEGKDHQLEFGLRISDRKIKNNFEVQDTIMGGWASISQFTNNFSYDERISAFYVQYANRFKNIENMTYQVGIRTEDADIQTALELGNNEDGEIKYIRIFPSAFINYELSDRNKLQLSYSNRIRRPRFFELNPFITFADRINRFEGNGSLNPEITNSFEFNYLNFAEGATLSAGIFYRNNENPIQRLQYGNAKETVRRPVNLKEGNEIGLDINYSFSKIKWYRLDANFNCFYFNISAENLIDTEAGILYGFLDESTATLSNFSWNSRLTNRFTFWKGSQLQLRGNIRGVRQSLQGKFNSIFSLDVGWTKDFLKQKNMTLTLAVRDLFNSRKRKWTTNLPLGYTIGEFQWRARTANLTLSYRINQRKKFKRPSFDRDEGGF